MNTTAPGTTSAVPRAQTPGASAKVLVLGGSSEIAQAIVRRLGADTPVTAWLVGRERSRLNASAASLRGAGIECSTIELLDAEELARHHATIHDLFQRSGGFDVVILAVGQLGDRGGLPSRTAEALRVMQVNFVGAGSMLLHCASELSAQGFGRVIVLSSVAAERPRKANVVYGASKAGLDSLAQGLSDATRASAIRILVVRPGFVRTRMTAGLKPAPMSTTPDAVAEATVKALTRGAHTVWVPSRLRIVMMVIRALPRAIFRRLPL